MAGLSDAHVGDVVDDPRSLGVGLRRLLQCVVYPSRRRAPSTAPTHRPCGCRHRQHQIEDALERDYFLTAEAAQEFGLVDKVIDKRPEEMTPPKPAT